MSNNIKTITLPVRRIAEVGKLGKWAIQEKRKVGFLYRWVSTELYASKSSAERGLGRLVLSEMA